MTKPKEEGLFEQDSITTDEAKQADIELAKKEATTTTAVTKPDLSKLKPWQRALLKSEGKFMAISNPEKTRIELGFAAQIIQNNDQLKNADPDSIMNSCINLARTSLTLNPTLRLAYLVVRSGKCCLDVSYIGLIKILKDNRCVKYVDAFIVYTDEDFDYDLATGKITHKPKYPESEAEQNKRKVYGAYSRAILPDGEVVYCFMPWFEIEKIKNTSKSGSSQYSPWVAWLSDMIKKTVIKRHFKFLIAGSPSEELMSALEIEEENNGLDPKFTRKKQSISDFFQDAEEVQ